MITINGVKPLTDAEQWIFLTIAADGDECQFTHVAPADLTGQGLQDYAYTNEESYRLDILKDMYPGAKPAQTPDLTELENFKMWISAGQINVGEDGNEIFIPKVPWTGEHPMETGITVLEFRQRFTFAERIAILESIDAGIGVFVEDLRAAVRVHVEHPHVIEGMDYLVSKGVITAERKVEILTS